jgi:hypothetical protein
MCRFVECEIRKPTKTRGSFLRGSSLIKAPLLRLYNFLAMGRIEKLSRNVYLGRNVMRQKNSNQQFTRFHKRQGESNVKKH